MSFNQNQKRWLSRIRRSFLALCSTIFRVSRKFFLFAVGQLFLELAFALVALVIAHRLLSWGIPQNTALILGVLGTFALLVLILAFWSGLRVIFKPKNQRGELDIAIKIAALAKKNSTWPEYQDWLHDILLARRQLMETNCPLWRVRLLTYWRLMGLGIAIAISKIRSISSQIFKLR